MSSKKRNRPTQPIDEFAEEQARLKRIAEQRRSGSVAASSFLTGASGLASPPLGGGGATLLGGASR